MRRSAAMQQTLDAIIRVACPQVSGSGLLPFTIDKQTLLLQTFTQQLKAMNLSVNSVSLSSVHTLFTALPTPAKAGDPHVAWRRSDSATASTPSGSGASPADAQRTAQQLQRRGSAMGTLPGLFGFRWPWRRDASAGGALRSVCSADRAWCGQNVAMILTLRSSWCRLAEQCRPRTAGHQWSNRRVNACNEGVCTCAGGQADAAVPELCSPPAATDKATTSKSRSH